MTHIRRFAFAGALAALASPAAAVSLDDYSSLIVFGDSLSDPGNLFAQVGVPGFPYFDGRFSSGPVWAEYATDDFAVSGNFAFGGAQAATDDDGIPDFAAQIDLYQASPLGAVQGDNPLAAIWFGANDLFGAIPSGSFTEIGAAAAAAVASISSGIVDLATNSGITDFVVFNLPDLGLTPLYSKVFPAASDGASDATDFFNFLLGNAVAGLDALPGLDVEIFDVNALFDDLVANPDAFGVTNVTHPCNYISGDPFVAAAAAAVAAEVGDEVLCSGDEVENRAFFDLVHPNGQVHAELARRFGAEVEMTPIPLPAGLPLLAVGLGGLILAGRRSARGRVAR